MTIFRSTIRKGLQVAALTAAGTLALAACGGATTPTGGDTSAAGNQQSGETGSALTCPAGSLTAEGSSAQQNAFEEVAAMYAEACGQKATINYNPTGSGAGIKSFYNGQADFAGSDSALKSEEKDGVVETEKAKERCEGNDAWNLPMVVGPVAFAYNVDGVDKLVVNAEVLADIFTGKIKTWNDPAIAALNEGATLPSDPITVFFRSDESGTTENVTKFLAAAGNDKWTKEPSKAWTGIGEGKNKSSGVAEAVKSTKNSISYMEWSYAADNSLKISQLDNGSGAVELSGENVAKAVAAAEVSGSGNDLQLKIDYTTKEAGAYPALLVTYEIVCSKGLPAEKTAVLKDFLTYFASPDTQTALEEIGYAPLPAELATKVTTAVAAIS